ncbi:MAG: tape measure protein [Azonexaceae bacterium]|nr:tape measure protein [Azonexaceae bacterium]
MANNDRRVTLTLAAKTDGFENIKNLSTQLREMASAGGDAAPEFVALATALESAATAEGQQAKAAKAANADLAQTKQSLLDARAAVSAYVASIGGARNATAEQAAELARLNRVVLDNRAANDSAKASTAAASAELNRSKAATRAAVAEAERLTAAVSKPGNAAVASAAKAEGAFSGMAGKLRGLAGPLLAAFGVQEWFQANANMESLRRSLELLTGSSKAAAAEIEYLKSTANRLGLDVQSTSTAYISLTAAAKGTRLEGAQTRAIFEAVSGAMAKLGRSSADTEGALQAVAQMMSKGVVSQEEMRQQLGERLPGALQATADAAGVTVGELNDMIATGNVLSVDLLPKLAEGLNKVYKTGEQVDGLVSSWARLKNAMTDTMTFIGDSGVAAGTVAFLGQVATAVRGLTGAFALLGQGIGITLGALATFDFKHPIDSVNSWRAAVVKAADDLQASLDKANGATKDTTEAQKALAEGGKAVSASANEQAVSWLTVVNAYQKVATASKEATALALKSAEAVAAEAKASVELAAGLGTETEKRVASLNAALANTDALQKVAEARRIEAAVANSNAIALQEAAKAEGALSEEKRKAIQLATDAATAKKSEADQAAAIAISAQQHAAILVVESAALADNSARVDELRLANEAAQKSLEAVRASRAAGIATLYDEQAAAIAAGAAAAIYRDALHDQTTAIEQNARAKAGQLSIEQAGVKLAIEQQRTILEVARARGDEYGAIMALTEIKRLEVKLSELTAQAKKAEAEAALLTVKAKRDELTASGELTAAKEAELKAQEAGAKVKQVEAEIASETAKRMRELADAYFYAGDAADGTAEKIRKIGDAARDSVDGVDSLTQSLNGMNSAQAGGMRVGGTGSFDMATELKKLGLSDEQIKSADQGVFSKAMQDGLAQMGPTDNPRLWSFQAAQVAASAAQQALMAGQAKNAATTTTNATTTPAIPRLDLLTPTAPQVTTQAPTPVNITIGGRTSTVNVASASDAGQLANIFRLIEADSARAF